MLQGGGSYGYPKIRVYVLFVAKDFEDEEIKKIAKNFVKTARFANIHAGFEIIDLNSDDRLFNSLKKSNEGQGLFKLISDSAPAICISSSFIGNPHNTGDVEIIDINEYTDNSEVLIDTILNRLDRDGERKAFVEFLKFVDAVLILKPSIFGVGTDINQHIRRYIANNDVASLKDRHYHPLHDLDSLRMYESTVERSTSMDWFMKIVRVAGASFPGASSLVQLQSEIDSQAMAKRLKELSDPISYLHEDVPEASKIIYENLRNTDSSTLDFSEEFYSKFSRPLAALESVGLISKNGVIGSRIPLGINLIDPSFILYMCNLAEDPHKMQEITDIVDRCELGLWLDGAQLKDSIGLPVTVIRSVFEVYESKGYGVMSETIGTCQYLSNA